MNKKEVVLFKESHNSLIKEAETKRNEAKAIYKKYGFIHQDNYLKMEGKLVFRLNPYMRRRGSAILLPKDNMHPILKDLLEASRQLINQSDLVLELNLEKVPISKWEKTRNNFWLAYHHYAQKKQYSLKEKIRAKTLTPDRIDLLKEVATELINSKEEKYNRGDRTNYSALARKITSSNFCSQRPDSPFYSYSVNTIRQRLKKIL